MKPHLSVAGRAALAVSLMAGFYVFAIGIAALLVYLPIAEALYVHRVEPRLAMFCLAGAATILWSIVPRWDRFPAPGPRLDASTQARLFAEIADVAEATGQKMPSEVFLVGEVNAFVAQRGGVMGFFSRRILGLGLPLLQSLTVPELRAVLAHEFGHFYGGDTRLGPWVYKTRSALGRTIGGLRKSWLHKPFLWYGNLFLRVSQAVSRRQEFSADALASRAIGSRPLIEGLKKVRSAAGAYDAYWSLEVVPVLSAGFLPPIAEGFRLFTTHERISKAMADALEKGLQSSQADPYDTHPPLPERIAAVANLPAGPDPASAPPAISLLTDLPALERRWLAGLAGPAAVDKLAGVAWGSVMTSVVLPMWRDAVAKNAAALGGATVGDLGAVVVQSRERATFLAPAEGKGATPQDRDAVVRWLAAAGATLALERAGWTVASPPGAPVAARKDGLELLPFDVVESIRSGAITEDAWREESSRLGVGALPLVEAAAPAQP